MWVALIWTIGDFLAYDMLSRWSTYEKLAYLYCMGHTKSFQLKYSRKAMWFDSHRQYLLLSHQFRQRYQFLIGQVEKYDPPLKLSRVEIKAQVDGLPPNQYGLFLKSKERLCEFGKSHN